MLTSSLFLCAVTVNYYIGVEETIRRVRPKGNHYFGCPIFEDEDISFLLYTRYNPRIPRRVFLEDDLSLLASHIDGNNPTVVYLHGFGETATGLAGQSIKDAYLQRGHYNVILVDWSPLAALPWYSLAVNNCHVVGRYLAEFLTYLEGRYIYITDVHVIGFSLGAEVAGFTGQELRKKGLKLSRITGLDPAYPLFNYVSGKMRLSRDDATFVDVVHTDGGILGFPSQIGHVDFFPNGGIEEQPGCDKLSALIRSSFEDLAFCSHKRAWKYYAESVNNEAGFLAVRCNQWLDFVFGFCSNDCAFMGIAANINSPNYGKYFLRTNPNPPFGMSRTFPGSYRYIV